MIKYYNLTEEVRRSKEEFDSEFKYEIENSLYAYLGTYLYGRIYKRIKQSLTKNKLTFDNISEYHLFMAYGDAFAEHIYNGTDSIDDAYNTPQQGLLYNLFIDVEQNNTNIKFLTDEDNGIGVEIDNKIEFDEFIKILRNVLRYYFALYIEDTERLIYRDGFNSLKIQNLINSNEISNFDIVKYPHVTTGKSDDSFNKLYEDCKYGDFSLFCSYPSEFLGSMINNSWSYFANSYFTVTIHPFKYKKIQINYKGKLTFRIFKNCLFIEFPTQTFVIEDIDQYTFKDLRNKIIAIIP